MWNRILLAAFALSCLGLDLGLLLRPRQVVPAAPAARAEEGGGSTPLAAPSEVPPDFVAVPNHRRAEDGTVYGDVMAHCPDSPFGDSGGRGVNVHETTHLISANIGNRHRGEDDRVYGFYVLEGRGVLLRDPALTMADAKPFVPQNLHGPRWNLYMVDKQRDFNRNPTYICDEWVAYVNQAASNVDDVKRGRAPREWTDGVAGACEFSVYAMGLAMAVAERDPAYWRDNAQFRNFVVWELRRARDVFLEGRTMPSYRYDAQDRFLLRFLESPEAAALRDFCRRELGGAWLDVDPNTLRNAPQRRP